MNPSTRTFRSETAAFFKGCVDHPRLARRIAIVLVSVIAMGLCVMVFNALGVGTDPFACFSYGMAEKLGVSLGTFEAIFHTVTFLVVFSLDRKLFGLGSLANMFLVGYSADFFTWLLGRSCSGSSPSRRCSWCPWPPTSSAGWAPRPTTPRPPSCTPG